MKAFRIKASEGQKRALEFESAMRDDQQRIAFDLLYAEHAAPLYRFALRLCGDPDDAEDLAAEALAQAFKRLSTFRGESSAKTWLCAIVLNQHRMLRRRRSTAQAELDEAQYVSDTFQFQDWDLANAICSLSPQLREAFLLVKGEGFTHAEAAKVAKVPVGTMYFRVSEAAKHLRKRLTVRTPDEVAPKP